MGSQEAFHQSWYTYREVFVWKWIKDRSWTHGLSRDRGQTLSMEEKMMEKWKVSSESSWTLKKKNLYGKVNNTDETTFERNTTQGIWWKHQTKTIIFCMHLLYDCWCVKIAVVEARRDGVSIMKMWDGEKLHDNFSCLLQEIRCTDAVLELS